MRQEEYKKIEYLYRMEYPDLLRYAKIHVDSEEVAKELVQDTFHTAIEKLEELQKSSNQSGWLVETLKFKIRTYKRRLRYDLELFIPLEKVEFTEGLPFPEERLELDAVLTTAKQKLSREDFYLFRRLIFEDASHLEVAQELGITVWTSQKRLSRIREELRKEFPDRGK